jgi:hypothetical protein
MPQQFQSLQRSGRQLSRLSEQAFTWLLSSNEAAVKRQTISRQVARWITS